MVECCQLMFNQVTSTSSYRSFRRAVLALGLFIVLLGGAFSLGYAAYPVLNSPNQDTEMLVSGMAAASLDRPNGDDAPVDAGTLDAGTSAGNPPVLEELYREAWTILEQDFYGETPDITRRTYGMIHGLVGTYNDPYTFFVEPHPRELERDELRGSFGGIGAEITQTEEGFTLKPLHDQPAAQAGIQEGDLLIRVDETEISLVMTADQVVALVRGELGSTVTLVVRRTLQPVALAASNVATTTQTIRAEELTFTVTRAEIRTPSMSWHLLDDIPETATIGYIQHRIFSERSPDEMRVAIAELLDGGAERFIIDLRGNPGGLVDSVVKIAAMWLESGVIMQEKKADGTDKEFRASGNVLVPDAPLVLIVDGGSASASEILAGALRDHQRALLVGEKTFGKGSVQLIRELADHSSLHVTNALWFTPEGHKIDGEGLLPDVQVEPGTDPLPAAIVAVQNIN